MLLLLSKDRPISDVQKQFSAGFPFLKLEFYKPRNGDNSMKAHLPHYTLLQSAGLKDEESVLVIYNGMTVAELEKNFREKMGMNVQVSRKSGMIWLETTMTDNWSLEKQNEHGREISLTPKPFPDTE